MSTNDEHTIDRLVGLLEQWAQRVDELETQMALNLRTEVVTASRLFDAEIEIGRLNDMLEVSKQAQGDRINEMRALTDVIRQMFDIPDDAPLTRSLENWLDRFNEINAQEKS